MCGFGVTNRNIEEQQLLSATRLLSRRGPDRATHLDVHGFSMFHHLLSITGEVLEQPFTDQDGDIFCLYNGQIYNHSDFGHHPTDGACLIPAYREFGVEFCKQLDGEFAIALVDFRKNRLILSTDSFATKPIWMAVEGQEIGVASYQSALLGMGFTATRRIPANTTLVMNLNDLEMTSTNTVMDFDTEQFKNSYDDWIDSFSSAVRKRTRNLREKAFITLSSGYDSGAIACEMGRLNVPFKAYAITGSENPQVLEQRFAMLNHSEAIRLERSQYMTARNYLDQNAEPFTYGNYSVHGDQASAGLSHICELARKEGCKILFSGQGADEILSDYGFAGKKIFDHSGFGGLFPDDLGSVFPYANFYDNSQVWYLNKEECVAGSHGIETRYPFLDKSCVQEFLWLRPELKNRRYKAPLAEFLERRGYPFDEGVKQGFAANKNLVLKPWRVQDYPSYTHRAVKAIKRRLKIDGN
jgi:asparagine synthetase B (glutamine-hydrolysing)